MAIRAPAKTRKHHPIHINMTSMVDIVFLLIIFFMLVSSFISAENVRLDLPRPEESLAEVLELPERIVLNCQYVPHEQAASEAVQYHLGPVRIASLEELAARLKKAKLTAAKEHKPEVQVVIRADKRVRYGLIRDAMKCIAAAGIKDMHIAAEVED
jgi:biopolymer transport protein ExbD